MEQKYKTLFSNVFFFALGNIGSKMIMFFLLPLYTNVLNTNEYGITELVSTSTNLLIPIISLSIQDAVLRFVLDKQNKKEEVLKNACLVMLLGSIAVIVMLPLFRRIQAIGQWSFYFVAIMLLQMYRTVFSLYIKVIGKTMLFAIENILYAFNLSVANIVLLLFLKKGVSGFFLAMIYSCCISVLFLMIRGRMFYGIKHIKINKKLMRSMLFFSIPMIINAVSWWINNSSDRVMLALFLSTSEVGVYAVASKIPTLINSVSGIFVQAWVISSVIEYDSNKDKLFYENIFKGYYIIMTLATSVIIMIIKPFMSIYVGNDFGEVWKYIPCLLLGAIFFNYASFFGAIYTAAKKNINVTITTLTSAVLNIILNLILIPKIHIYGAVIATMFSHFIIGVFRMFDSRRYFSFKINYKLVGFSLGILMIQCIMVSMNKYAVESSLLALFLLIVIHWSNLMIYLNIIKRSCRKIILLVRKEK